MDPEKVFAVFRPEITFQKRFESCCEYAAETVMLNVSLGGDPEHPLLIAQFAESELRGPCVQIIPLMGLLEWEPAQQLVTMVNLGLCAGRDYGYGALLDAFLIYFTGTVSGKDLTPEQAQVLWNDGKIQPVMVVIGWQAVGDQDHLVGTYKITRDGAGNIASLERMENAKLKHHPLIKGFSDGYHHGRMLRTGRRN